MRLFAPCGCGVKRPFVLFMYLLNISGRPDRFSEDTRVKQKVLMKPVRSLPQVIEMLPIYKYLADAQPDE